MASLLPVPASSPQILTHINKTTCPGQEHVSKDPGGLQELEQRFASLTAHAPCASTGQPDPSDYSVFKTWQLEVIVVSWLFTSKKTPNGDC